ncbi:hypothetical protein [Sigmofec virus UA08Rod_6706]|uniref:Uncharacterized protein n=1 Tax=Sigmofec virus UA08Rod_6706 TaxID=2929237 RepID=A0A976N1L5_9VIRU|nr:hypothetical protein [Sigmofec virus UA08Rod_6706]
MREMNETRRFRSFLQFKLSSCMRYNEKPRRWTEGTTPAGFLSPLSK